jgi:flavin reductase (DIM6/NTAB) family NADH-FMN oxidoreductase RutF
MNLENFFHPVDPESIHDNIFKLLDRDWMLITAGNMDSFNTMTASWGAFGILWNKQVAFCFIRPQRYTYQFMEKNSYFTLSFFEETYRSVLDFCGSHSGRHVDKISETGLTPITTSLGNVGFKESRLIFECQKIYFDDLRPQHFLDETIHANYPGSDYHRLFIGEIIKAYLKA